MKDMNFLMFGSGCLLNLGAHECLVHNSILYFLAIFPLSQNCGTAAIYVWKNKIVITLRKTACFLLHIPFTFSGLGFADRRVQHHHKCRGWWTQSYIKFSLLTLQMNSQECCSAGTNSVLCFSRSAQAATWLSLWLRDKGILTKDCAQAQ